MSVSSIFEIIQIMSERRKVKARIERQRSAAGGSPFAGSSPPFPSEDDDHHDHDDNVYMTMMMTNQHDHKRMIIHIIKCSHMLNLYIILYLDATRANKIFHWLGLYQKNIAISPLDSSFGQKIGRAADCDACG